MPIVYRLTKGSPLTHAELDGNFQFLTGSINAISGTYATTGSNTFNGNQTVYGNLSVFGTASFTFTTSSVTEISASTFGINIVSPTIRFGRYDVYDTGSTVSTSSFMWDSGNTRWIYLRTTGSVSSSAVLLTGPLGSSGPGNETVIPQYRVPMSNGNQSLVNSNIYTSGSLNIVTGSTRIFSFTESPTPVLGKGSGSFFLGGDDGSYGLYMGISSSGDAWIQSNRNDGLATAYNISLQPAGGNIGIGKFNLGGSGPKLDISGSTLITGSVGILGNISINGALNTSNITASLLGTSSYAAQALSSSYAAQALSASYALTASYAANIPATSSYALQALNSTNATSASYALTASYVNPLTQTLTLTGSLFTRNTSSTTTVATIGRSGSLYIDLNGAGNNYIDGNILYVRNSAGTSNIAQFTTASTTLSSTTTTINGNLGIDGTTTMTGSLYMRRTDGPFLLRATSSLSSSISSSIVSTTASFNGTITFTPGGSGTTWNTNLDIYYSGNSGSGHTNLSPVSNQIADSNNYNQFIITLDNGITLTPSGSIPDDKYTIWIYASGSINKWFEKTDNVLGELGAPGLTINIGGPDTDTNLENDLIIAGFANVSDPNPYTNNISVLSTTTTSFTSSLFQINATSSFTGSLNVSGSTSFIGTHTLSGSNTIQGNTVLSGSFIVSGSTVFNNTSFTVTGSQFFTGSSVSIGNQTITGSLSLTSNGIGTGLFINGQKQFNYISLYHTASILPTQNVSGSFIYSTTGSSSGISLVSGSRITFANTGIYNIQFSAQTFTATGATVDIWFKRNGTNIAFSGTKIGPTSNNQYVVAAWNFVDTFTSGSYVEIAYQSDQTNTQFQYIAASGNIPAIPSVIASVTQVA